MDSSTSGLILASNASIDLQLHTVNSDGNWRPDELIDYLIKDGFALAAITDHDRLDTMAGLQKLAKAKHFPLVVAVEMSAMWHNKPTDVLCYGFDLDKSNDLNDLAQFVARRQRENTREVYARLVLNGDLPPESEDSDDLEVITRTPSAQQPHDLVALIKKYRPDHAAPGKVVKDAGLFFATVDIHAVVATTHRSGGVCLLAHPGRGGDSNFDEAMLDNLLKEIPVDGLEVYYPSHSASRISRYLIYARQHNLLVSAGSDSHGRDYLPVKYPANLCRLLLERIGIQIER
jgi:predicted metal-dependent phosphoesterase TrpH